MTETEERDYANGADGISDIEGKVARVATSKLGMSEFQSTVSSLKAAKALTRGYGVSRRL